MSDFATPASGTPQGLLRMLAVAGLFQGVFSVLRQALTTTSSNYYDGL